jgi:hypothetical protein
LNSGFCACKAGTLPPEPHLQSIFALVILEMGSLQLSAQTGLETWSSWSQPPSTELFLVFCF